MQLSVKTLQLTLLYSFSIEALLYQSPPLLFQVQRPGLHQHDGLGREAMALLGVLAIP